MLKPPVPPRHAPERSFGQKVGDFLSSPQLVLMTLAGIILVLGVPYFAYRSIPGASELFTPAPEPVDPNLGMDFSIIGNLPEELSQNVGLILAAEEPRIPAPLIELPEASGFGLIYPVSETIEPLQPALSWMNYAPPPYSVQLKNAANQVIARIESIPVFVWLVPVTLERGARYSWQVTAGNGEVETASFIVLDAQTGQEWQEIRRDFKDSHLVLGLVAEEFGLLTVAEREYKELIKAFPNAEGPARLLANVEALRDDPGAVQQQPEVF